MDRATINDALICLPFISPGCVVPPYSGLLTFNPFRVWILLRLMMSIHFWSYS